MMGCRGFFHAEILFLNVCYSKQACSRQDTCSAKVGCVIKLCNASLPSNIACRLTRQFCYVFIDVGTPNSECCKCRFCR